MKYKFAPAYLSAIVCTSVLLFTACTSSGDDKNPANSGDQPTPVPPQEQVTAISPIVINKGSVTSNAEKTRFNISGGATINVLDTTAIPDGATVAFTDVDLTIVKVDANGADLTTPLTVTFNKPAGTISNINLSELGASISDTQKSDCGTFRVYATYKATYDMNNPSMFISRDTISIVREQNYCEEEQQTTPIQKPDAVGSSVELVQFTAEVDCKSGKGISLATGEVVPNASADIYFTATEDGEVTVHSSNGTTIAEFSNANDTNWDDDWYYSEDGSLLPAEPAHMSDFRFRTASLTTMIKSFDGFKFIIATTPNYNADTGDGFYAFTMMNKTIPDANKNVTVTILGYKKK